MSEELIPPFTGPISKETATFRAKQAVEYYHKQLKLQPSQDDATAQWEVYEPNMNGYNGGRDNKNYNKDGRQSAQSQYSEPPERFVRGGQRATVHGTHSSGRIWQKNLNNHTNNQRTQNYNNVETRRHVVPQEHRTGSKKRYSRGLHRSNSNLEESLECINVDNLDISVCSKREYGSTSSLDMMNASTSSDSFFQMLENLRPENTDQRSPAPSKLQEVLRGTRNESKNRNLLRDLEKIANGSVIINRPVSDELDDGTHSPRTKAKFKQQKDRKTRSKSITPDTGQQGVWKRIRGKNDMEGNTKTQDSFPESENRGDDRFRRKALVHYDSQSIGFDINAVLKRKVSVSQFANITTGASAASGTRESYAGDAEDPGIAISADEGDGRSNDLLHSCSFFRNEIGGEEERTVGLTHRTAHSKHGPQRDNNHNRSAIVFNRSPQCCGVTVLDCSPTLVGHILPPYTAHKGHVIEYVDTGANYYRHFFNSSDHQNYFGVDDSLGPVAVSIKREKLDERENHLGKSESGLYQYRVIFRTSELITFRGSVLEDAIQTSSRLSSSKGIPVKDLLEFLVPEVQSSCLRQAIVGQKTCDQLIKLDEQRIFNTYKIGILYCKAGQSAEEDMYNNEHGSPAFEEFLNLIGDKVRLKGFEKYRAQLDNKSDSTGTHSVYTNFNNAEIMFHVSTLLPYTPKNQQQLLRKRHIGNDIVTVIFQEPGAAPFTARSVRSQFQHVFIIIRVHNPCSDKTSYSIAVSRSKDVPPFGPIIPEHAKFPKSKEFAEFLLAKIVNAENAAHHSEKFSAMASRTRHEYLKDLAANYITSNSLESASKLSKFALSGKKKEKNRGKVVPDNFALGAVIWHVQVEDVGKACSVSCFLGIAAETLVIVEEATKHVIFTTHCGSVIGWTSQALSMKLYYNQGECVMFKPSSGDMEELQEIVTRLTAVTPGCETAEFTLKRNGLGQLGFHIQAEGIVTDVETLGFASEAGLRKGSRLVEICKVSTVTLSHEQMVDLLRTSATVKVVVIPPLQDGGPRGVVNLHANHHYSSFPALNAVFQAEYSIHQRQTQRSSSSSSENLLSPITPVSPRELQSPRESMFYKTAQKKPKDVDIENGLELSYKEVRESWELREIKRKGSRESYSLRDSADYDILHQRESSISSCLSQASQRSTNMLPLQNKSSSSSSSSSSDHRGDLKSPSTSRAIYVTDSTWQSSSLPHGAKNSSGYHCYQDSTVSSGHGSMYEGRDLTADHYSSASRGLDDSSYGTLEERHSRQGSKDSGDHHPYGGSRDWSARPQRPPAPSHSQSSQWLESRSSSSHSTYLTSSTDNILSSSLSQSTRKPPSNTEYIPPSVQHGNYAHELLKQSQNTKYLLSQGSESSRREGGNSANSSSVNLSDTSFSSGGSAHTANMPQPSDKDDIHSRRRANTTAAPQMNKSRNPVVTRNPAVNMSPSSSVQSSPRSSQKNLSGMSSEESLATRLRPGVTTKLTKSQGTTNLQDDLMRLIDPDLDDNDLQGILRRSPNRGLSGRLQRTMSDESLHSGKGGHSGVIDPDLREALFAAKQQDKHGSREQLRPNRLSPRAVTETKAKVPMPDSTANLDWSSLVDVATKAIEASPEPNERISSPVNSIASSNTSITNKSSEVKVDSLYRQQKPPVDRQTGPPTGTNPPVWRSVVANPHARIQELENRVEQLEDDLAQERQESAALDLEVQRLRNENARLQEESQTAAAQLRRFTEWFFTTIDRQ